MLRSLSKKERRMDTKKVTPTIDPAQYPPILLDANRIVEEFSTQKYVIYFLLFSLETALAFWVALSL